MRKGLPTAQKGIVDALEGRKIPEAGEVNFIRPTPREELLAHTAQGRRLLPVIRTAAHAALLLRAAQKILLRDAAVLACGKRGEDLIEFPRKRGEIVGKNALHGDAHRDLLCGTKTAEGEQSAVACTDARSLL